MSLSLSFARREMRAGIKGFRIFLACLALGVAALAAAGSTADAFRHGLAAQARSVLGGDLSVSVEGRRFTDAEQIALRRLGEVSDRLHVRAMASTTNQDMERRLVEVSGIDANFPLAGKVVVEGASDLGTAVEIKNGLPGAAVAPELLVRLKVKVGDTVLIGTAPFQVRATIINEPDTLGRGFPLGPRVLVSKSALLASGILESNSLFGEVYTVAISDGAADTPHKAGARLKALFPNSGFHIKEQRDALSGLGRVIDQLEFFLSFIGLASLLTGGLGIASAVSAYLTERQQSIAVLKALGANSALIRNIYLIQLGVLTAFGIILGLAVGAITPFLLGAIAGNHIPVPVLFSLYPWALAKAALFGCLATLVFSLYPLAKASVTSPASLFRKDVKARVGWGLETAVMILAIIALIALSAITAPSPVVAGVMLVGLMVGFLILWGAGQVVTRAAATLRRLFKGALRIGLANLAGPRSAAHTASPSMGFGIALLTMIILIQSSLLAQVTGAAGQSAPSLVFTQIAPELGADFDRVVSSGMGALNPDRYRRYPFATGRITAVNGIDTARIKIAPNVKWAFDQDLTLTALDAPPPERSLSEGAWWPPGYSGEPRVILDAQIAQGANIHINEAITIALLGRDLEVRVAGIRKIDFGQFGANFPIVLSARALEGANLREIAIARTSRRDEDVIVAAVGRAFPSVNIVSVREQLDAAARIFDQIGWAIRAAAGIAAVASLLVLVGAIAANAQARSREAAVLKVLGATRGFIALTYCVEYGAVGMIAGVTGIALGTAAAYPIVHFGLHAGFVPDWGAVLAALAAVIGVGATFGLMAAIASLSRRPNSALRSE